MPDDLWQTRRKGIAATLVAASAVAMAVAALGCARDLAASDRGSARSAEASRLVEALSSSDNGIRAPAAEKLRRLLEAHPEARTNDHGRDYWAKRIASVKVGMNMAEVQQLLPVYPRGDYVGRASGGVSVWNYRLDHYWMTTVYCNDSITETEPNPQYFSRVSSEHPQLESRAMDIWVQQPTDFTGTWLTWHVNGQKSHEIECRNGRYHGIFTCFHDNGRKSYEQHYVDGVVHGADTGWYRDGVKCYEGRYENDKMEGRWTHWYPDGKLQIREEWRSGQWHGPRHTWHPNGQKQYEEDYAYGERVGASKAWDETGKLLWAHP